MKAHATILLLAITTQPVIADSIYTWKDENGKVHFSDKSQSPKAREVGAAPRTKAGYSSSQLLGTWAVEVKKNGVTLRSTFTLKANGGFSGDTVANGNPFMLYAGKWELVGDRINWLYTESNIPLPEAAKKDSDKIISVTPSRIEILSILSGEKRVMVRQGS